MQTLNYRKLVLSGILSSKRAHIKLFQARYRISNRWKSIIFWHFFSREFRVWIWIAFEFRVRVWNIFELDKNIWGLGKAILNGWAWKREEGHLLQEGWGLGICKLTNSAANMIISSSVQSSCSDRSAHLACSNIWLMRILSYCKRKMKWTYGFV